MKNVIMFFLFLYGVVCFGQQEINDAIYLKRRDSVIELARESYFKRDSTLLKKYTKKVLSFYDDRKDSVALAKYYYLKALYNKLDFAQDSAYYYYYKSKDISILLKDSIEVGRRLLSMGNLQKNVNNFMGSELSLNEALVYLKSVQSNKYLTSVYTGLGNINSELNKFIEARENYNKAYEVNKFCKDEKRKISSDLYIYNNFGLSFQRQGNHEKAIKYFNKGIKFYQKIKEEEKKYFSKHYALLLENLTYSSYSLGKKEGVLEDYLKVVSINKTNNNIFFLATNYINISNFYIDSGDEKKAKDYIYTGFFCAKKSHNNKRWLEALLILSDLTKGETSKKYLLKYIQLNDSLLKKEREVTSKFAKIKFENERREKEIAVLSFENEKSKNKIDSYKKRVLTLSLVIVVCLLSLFIGFLVVVFRRKRLLLNEELKRIKSKEEERTRISKELHDGILGELFGVRLGLGFFNLKLNKKEETKYENHLNSLQKIEKEIREVSHKLTIDVDGMPFIELLEKLLKEKSNIGGFNYEIKVVSLIKWKFVSSEIKTNFHRIIHELLNNIIKHANASKVVLEIKEESDLIVLKVSDDGVGFDKNMVIDGIGVNNIKSRVNKLKGELNIDSIKEKGTTIKIYIPY